MAGFFKTTFAVAAGILASVVALAALAAGAMVVYHGHINVPNYVLVADPGETSVWCKDAATRKAMTLEPEAEVDFVTATASDELIVRYHQGDLKDREWIVPKRNLRSYATGKPLSP
jgi:hypothetical protein